MWGMTLADVAAAVSAKLIGSEQAAQNHPTGGSIDTRDLEPGALFFALKGERSDGHRFIDQAFARGACAAVVDLDWFRNLPAETKPDGPLIPVKAVDLALGDLARAYRRRFQIPVVGITGSNGKTTTKDMSAAVLETRYRVLATEGNLNTRLGVPLTLLRLSKAHEVAVIEMGISEYGGLRYLCEIADPNIGVITNIGPTHLEFLGSVEGVAKAKGELLSYLGESSMTILNLDDLLLSKERATVKGRLLGFGVEKICQFRGEGLTLDQEGCGHFSLQSQHFHLPIPGRHNVYNALAAAAVGAALDVPLSDAAQALLSFRLSKLRSQVLTRGDLRLLNDTYNANPASMRAALDALKSMSVDSGGRRIAVLGDMLELGDAAGTAHRDLGIYAAGCDLSVLFTLGHFSEPVAQAARDAGIAEVHAFENREDLQRHLTAEIGPGDLVLIKGSRGLAMEALARAIGFEV